MSLKPIVKTVLESGLVEKHQIEMMERWGFLDPGAAELVKEDKLQNATREQLTKLAEEIGTEVDKARTLRETQLDIDRLRWPTIVSIKKDASGGFEQVAYKITALIDRMGRLYFRSQDVDKSWFVPGYIICREVASGDRLIHKNETILESGPLYVDDSVVCIQVTTTP